MISSLLSFNVIRILKDFHKTYGLVVLQDFYFTKKKYVSQKSKKCGCFFRHGMERFIEGMKMDVTILSMGTRGLREGM